MATLEQETSPPLPPAIRRQLDALRARVRRYVWLEGLAAMAVWVGAAFWGSMAIDWCFEPPRPVRAAVLAARRPRPGRRALPLHPPPGLRPPQRRQHGHAPGAAVPAIQRQPADLGIAAATTATDPAASIPRCSLAPAVWPSSDWMTRRFPKCSTPCRWCARSSSPLGLALAVVLLAAVNRPVLDLWAERNLLLSNATWPRKIRLEAVGFTDDGDGHLVAKVAAGGEFRSPRAGLPRRYRDRPSVPDKVEVRYRDEGRRPRPEDHEEHRPAGDFRRRG